MKQLSQTQNGNTNKRLPSYLWSSRFLTSLSLLIQETFALHDGPTEKPLLKLYPSKLFTTTRECKFSLNFEQNANKTINCMFWEYDLVHGEMERSWFHWVDRSHSHCHCPQLVVASTSLHVVHYAQCLHLLDLRFWPQSLLLLLFCKRVALFQWKGSAFSLCELSAKGAPLLLCL